MEHLKRLDDDTIIQLVDTAYQYMLDKKSVPLKKLSVAARVPFSAIYSFLKGNPEKRIKEINSLDLSEAVKKSFRAKIYLMYAQNFTKIGLLNTYSNELAKVTNKSNNSVALPGQALSYVGCIWKVNVVLSTNYTNRVLRPEVQIEIFTKEDR